MENLIEVDTGILLFAFRYALNRNTTAPGFVSKYVKHYWRELGSEYRRQIEEDIERQIRVATESTTSSIREGHWVDDVSDDWVELLRWIKRKKLDKKL